MKYDKDYWPGSGQDEDDYKALQEYLYPERDEDEDNEPPEDADNGEDPGPNPEHYGV